MADEKIWHIANEFVVNIEEDFYALDIDFNSENCNILFYEIIKLFIEKGHIYDYKIELHNFKRKCYFEADKNGPNDYSLFYDNINILLELDYINTEDIERLKFRVKNQIVINNRGEQKSLSRTS